jgi:selenoprotein W-related protein
LAAELKQLFDANVELIAGSGGNYDIIVDGKEVFSKSKAGRFPEPGEVVNLIKSI